MTWDKIDLVIANVICLAVRNKWLLPGLPTPIFVLLIVSLWEEEELSQVLNSSLAHEEERNSGFH